MSALYEQLRGAGSDQERRTITNAVFDEMRLNPDAIQANEAYFGVCAKVIDALGHVPLP